MAALVSVRARIEQWDQGLDERNVAARSESFTSRKQASWQDIALAFATEVASSPNSSISRFQGDDGAQRFWPNLEQVNKVRRLAKQFEQKPKDSSPCSRDTPIAFSSEEPREEICQTFKCCFCSSVKLMHGCSSRVEIQSRHPSIRKIRHHEMCRECLSSMVAARVVNFENPSRISCPCGCKGSLTYASVRDLIKDSHKDVFEMFDRRLKGVKKLVGVCSHCDCRQDIHGRIDAFGTFTCEKPNCRARNYVSHGRLASVRKNPESNNEISCCQHGEVH